MIIINLLPVQKRASLKTTVVSMAIKTFVIAVGIFVVCIAGILFLNENMLQRKISDTQELIQETTNATVVDRGGTVVESTQKINQQLKVIKTIEDAYNPLSPVVYNLLTRIPEGITLDSFLVDAKLQTVNFIGIANTRDSLIALRTEVEKIPYFTEWTSPVSNLTQRENIEFDFSATLSDDYLSLLSDENKNSN
ncbi:MAG: hypothetical protein A2898_04035 [Candidatus Kerfeldbacteria bacterium RIFCSPLOWO2_01_FULL_48_11]|uniref:PilN domain-containing protein n=1 Tax=Candidatus Kerfeldbacteria bacterium RIFCSPLOWO2_01_FULL_48_11 TaxID=1798543 RepID=A0A1G2B222_9BACT|nr:MAG: hypothetical protein UY34_C0001G0010 [Parcubacteria group bacterium GW2011_GWA2_48_9]KKW16147.1 MAG: hypothetical protein UY52_C0009G0007 [Parcubacteria group bacterium GW2011_GWC2_49_9]OGY82739.1 MAG: hypothetical protein A2898_04035 [Candidatus Kerfeldbacteria bacterium RIFCSPLOWO2_01_FULL_48_11]HCJ52368.1 hypothetical protein [Candidatus Kerfeldbacteria bacterium]HCM68341.1 hypothetical protein [Candidatus Kerfeldbacteria bacterium]